jgi:hypothetical protein
MHNRLRYFLTPLIFIVVASASTYVAYSRQQPAQNSTGSISGRLTSAQKPLSGIEVRLLRPPKAGNSQKTRVAAVTTDDNGYYQFTGVAVGSYDVVPVSDRYFVSDVTRNYETGKTVMVASGQEVDNIDFDMPTFGKIEGQLRDSDGRPVTQFSVSLATLEKSQKKSRSQSIGAIIKPSDSDGNYSIEKVPPGSYIVLAGNQITYSMMVQSDAAKHPLYPLTYHPGTTDATKASPVAVEPGATVTAVDITIEPVKTCRITGRVTDEQTGAPIPKVDFVITYQESDGRKTDVASGHWQSDVNGQFKMPVVLPGHMIIKPSPSAAKNAYGDPLEIDVADQDITGLEIKMHRASTLSGQVVIDTSNGTADITRLSQLKYSVGLYLKEGFMQSSPVAVVEPDGRFRFTGLFPGVFKFTINPVVKGALQEFHLLRVERDGQPLRDGIEIGKGEDLTGLRLVVRATGANS